MSVKMSMKNFQYHKETNCISSENPINLRNASTKMMPFSFPPSKTVLWDSTPMGDAIGLHFSYYRNPRLLVAEKALRLSYRHARTERKLFSCFLLGTLSVDQDEEGATLTIDRFDPGRDTSGSLEKVPTALLPGDFLIPCSVGTRGTSGNGVVNSHEDLTSSFKGLQSHLDSKEALDLSKLLTVRAHITYTESMDNLHFDLHWSAVTVANTFESTPIKPVPIIPTALARNLSSHNNIAQLQGTHKCGYLTMDQTRKLLLVLESDPKVYTLPLVGIWLSGVTHIHSPQVWSSALRYMFSSSINERVLSESGSFLIVLYSLTHKEPEMYECSPCSGHDQLGFQLLTSEEALHLFKNVNTSNKKHIQFELATQSQNSETDFLNEASKRISATVVSPNKLSISDHDSGVEDEDFSPRPSPCPHPSTQQVTRIHPSVPELSLVFGSFIESKSVSQNSENGNSTNNPSLTPNCANDHLASYASNEQQHFENHARDPSFLKAILTPLNSMAPTMKPAKGKSSPAERQPTRPKSGNQTRKNSASSSSSSPSTPLSGSSPDISVHQVKGSSEQHDPNGNMGIVRQGPPPIRRSTSSTKWVSTSQCLNHNATFPLRSRHLAEAPKSAPHLAPIYQTNVCNCCHSRVPTQCHSTRSWPGMGTVGQQTMQNQSEPLESIYPACHQNMACPSVFCSPVCVTSCPKSTGHSSKVGHCSPPLDHLILSPGRRDSLPTNPCSPHSCIPSPMVPPVHGMLGLSTEAYLLLAEQDKQLKMLQAQIQRLLEAQTAQSFLKTSVTTGSSQKQTASVFTETQSCSGLERKQSVSIAVSTGASLFWNSQCSEEEDCVVKQDDTTLSNMLSVAVNNEDTSHTSIASSLNAVDICSFVENSRITDGGNNLSAAAASLSAAHVSNQPGSPVFQHDQSSVSVNTHAAPPEGTDNLVTAALGQSGPCVRPEKFYQDLLCQVNNMLKTSPAVDEESCSEYSAIDGSLTCTYSSDKKKCPSNPRLSDQNDVLKATLKQLKTLGVNVDMNTSEMKKKNTDTADIASILACINPDAVIPRLNYMSFTNIGMSGFVPNGVDLSMEANAIALKYLSESQLTQLSQSRADKNTLLDSSSFHNLLPGNTEKSMVGFSFISPSNMSFATKKYMKRYGLIESNDSSDDETDLPTENGYILSDAKGESLDKNRSFPDASSTESSQPVCERPKHDFKFSGKPPNIQFLNQPDANKLRNITNEISPKSVTAAHLSEETSVPFQKDLKSKKNLSSGKAQFTRHPEKENTGDKPFFPEKASSSFGKKGTDCPNSVGDILDVNRLRQLPKLF
ncbi:SCL-interrupting locus protein [Ascaphus truei]|uniref:SCL-interrupting locus protein n=1 Tax=Ascaphus truei TaxID=8439 RepID=UPI003F59AE7C